MTLMHEYMCRANEKLSSKENVRKWCQSTLDMDPENAEALMILGQAKIDDEEYEEAVRMFKTAHENGGGQRVSRSLPISAYPQRARLG